jgi:hypothetical protein
MRARARARRKPAVDRAKRKPAVDRDVANAAGHGGKPKARRLRIWKWLPISRGGSLAGFCSVEFAIGLRIEGLPVFRTGIAGPWVGQPRTPRLDRDKRQMRGDDGRLVFDAAFAWRDRETANAFSAAVLALLIEKWPDALDVRGERDRPAATPTDQAQEALPL